MQGHGLKYCIFETLYKIKYTNIIYYETLYCLPQSIKHDNSTKNQKLFNKIREVNKKQL